MFIFYILSSNKRSLFLIENVEYFLEPNIKNNIAPNSIRYLLPNTFIANID